jgi:DNA-binding NarL/FixJ family response regulator
MPLRILIVDDHAFARKGLRSVLERREDFEICGEATNGKQAITETMELRPDVVVMDVSMPVLNGLEAARSILEKSPNTPIVFISMYNMKEILIEAHEIGARAYVLKADAEQNLANAVDAASRKQMYFPRYLS